MNADEFLADFPPYVQALAHELRALVKRAIPDVLEIVYPGWRLIGYKVILDDRQAYFCYVAPSPEQVTLGFEYGVLLADPHGLLHGDGSQVRHIPIADPQDIAGERLAYYIREAARLASLSRDERVRLQMAREEEVNMEKRLKPAKGGGAGHKSSGDSHNGTGRD